MTTQHAIMIIDPERALADSRMRKDIVKSMMDENILRPNIDYGVIPGSTKPTLLKPGAERLCSAFGLNPQFETLTAIEKWDGDEPLFFYRYKCHLIHIESGLEIATGIGSCNSREARYRWRWATEDKVPAYMDKSRLETRNASISEFDFAVKKAETTGKYGKPAEYWQRFQDAIADGTARQTTRKTRNGENSVVWEIGGVEYRIPNDDIASLVNTVDKIAQKRSLIAVTLIGANASEFFTQDIEDLIGFGVDIAGETLPTVTITEVEPWTKDEATDFARVWVDRGLTTADLFKALGIQKGWGEWKGTVDEAHNAVREWHNAQLDGSTSTAPGYDKQAVYEAVKDLYTAFPHFTNSLTKLAAEGKIVAGMTTDEVVNVVRAHKAQA